LEEGEQGITRIDDIRYADFFSALERANVLMASLHIADPNGPFDDRQPWMADPAYYWTQIRAFENMLAKYPQLTVVAAHGAWLVCQDGQIDYLRYMLSTYPNLYMDISATFHYMHLVNRDNLRDFYIEYQDRILYGTDGERVPDGIIHHIADQYAHTLAVLETDQTINGNGGFFGNNPVNGLELPKEVLEKIYYKNALQLYPRLKEAMEYTLC
jgi:predicted TIM-barrel fold metal-dependent hydrolase